MKIELIDFRIDFIKFTSNYDVVAELRKFNNKYIEIQKFNRYGDKITNITYTSELLKAVRELKEQSDSYKFMVNLVDNYFLVEDHIVKDEWDLIVKKSYVNTKRDQIFSENCEIELNDLIYKIQDIVIDENSTEQKYIGSGIKYFLYNKEQNRTITLYDHQVKFIQKHFNKT